MANFEYITFADIRHPHLKQLGEARMQPYIDDQNDHLESLARSLGIMDVEQIKTPIDSVIRDYLVLRVLWWFSVFAMGNNNVVTPRDEDMYVLLMEESKPLANDMKAQITPEMITQTISDRSQTTVSFGRIMRS